MKIIKQLSEKQFVIEMEDYDLNKRDEVIIAHDYVRFESNHGIQTDLQFNGELYGPYKICENWIAAYNCVTLSIRQMQEVIIPYLIKHKFMKPEHLLKPDGTPNYTWNQEYGTVIHDNSEFPGKHNIYLYRGNSDYDIMDVEEYEHMHTGIVDEDDNKIYLNDELFNFKDMFSGKVIEHNGKYAVKITKCKRDYSRIGEIIPLESGYNYIKQG